MPGLRFLLHKSASQTKTSPSSETSLTLTLTLVNDLLLPLNQYCNSRASTMGKMQSPDGFK